MCPGVPAAADALGPTAAPRPDARLEGMAAATAGAGGALPCAVPAPLDEDYFALGAGGAAPAAASGASPRGAALPRADAHEPESAAEGAAGFASEAPAPQPPGAAAQEAVPAGEAARTYGGRFTWVGAEYRLRVAAGLSPLQWLNIATNSILSLDSLCFSEDGGFHRPGAEEPAFPVGGVDLRWRYDPASARIVIDFFKRGELLPWRWDELRLSPDLRFPSTVPDLYGTGHVGKRTFRFAMLSAAAEEPPSAAAGKG